MRSGLLLRKCKFILLFAIIFSNAVLAQRTAQIIEICPGESVELISCNGGLEFLEWVDENSNTITTTDANGVTIPDGSPIVTPASIV